MSVRIEKDFYFQAALHFEGQFYVNSYDLTLSMLVETDNIREQNIAMERTTHFLHSVIQNSILVKQSKHNTEEDVKVIENYKNANIRICELPEEPYDQILGMALIQKLNAIMEGRLKITDMVIGSVLSDDVRFSLVSEISEAALAGNHWWNKSTICINEEEAKAADNKSKGNIVKLFDDTAWVDLGLSWKEKGKK